MNNIDHLEKGLCGELEKITAAPEKKVQNACTISGVVAVCVIKVIVVGTVIVWSTGETDVSVCPPLP